MLTDKIQARHGAPGKNGTVSLAKFSRKRNTKAEQERPKTDGVAVKDYYVHAMEHLVSVVQELSLARDLEGIMAIVRHAARKLTGADGATFILRDNGCCYYADEEAIAPLWKGKRFPLERCISGWAMLNKQPAVIRDIYDDPRIPAEAYRPTFVKSLAMFPFALWIRSAPSAPIGRRCACPSQKK